MKDYTAILNEIHREIQPHLTGGQVADYIPELARIPLGGFGMALVDMDGNVHTCGDAARPFSIQSVSKVFTLTLALKALGDDLWDRVGREPSGSGFNSLLHLEYEHGKPRNPFINAGALVVTDVLLDLYPDAVDAVVQTLRRLSGNPDVGIDEAVAASEESQGFRNASLANFLKSYGGLDHEVGRVLSAYFRHCAIEMSAVDLACAGFFLINQGVPLGETERFISPNRAKYINSLMLTCGTYDSVGDFAYRVGLPGKSGVGGGILAVMPGRFSVCVWSPGLDAVGNSLAGTLALEWLTTKTGISIF
ncbi:glutaminase [bacterium]|nr:glutaminase [bacterium]